MLKVADWQLKNPQHWLTYWTKGAFYAGVFAPYETTKSKEILAAMMEMGEKNKYLPAVKKGWIGLNSLITQAGKVGWTQPIGADPRRNFNAETWEVHGAGAYLLAKSEVIKLK